MESRTKVIVVTCVKDEAWMLDRFLATCSRFADHIIISDESTGLDDSRAIFQKYPKAIVHANDGPSMQFDLRKRFVFDEARKIQCDKRIIVAIDADEVLSANLLESLEWQTVLAAAPGTLFHLQWVNLWLMPQRYKVESNGLYGHYGRNIWVDDGISEIPEHGVQGMHMVYTPQRAANHVYLTEIVCLHYQFCNWQRMEAKHRYYRVHEKVNIAKLSDLGIARMYGYMRSKLINSAPSPSDWFDGWQKLGLDMTSLGTEELYYFDLEVLKLLDRHGTDLFVFQDIWSADWEIIIARAKDRGLLPQDYQLQRPKPSLASKLFQTYIRKTIDMPLIRKIEWELFKKKLSYL